MHLERYKFEVRDNRYNFFSQGPKGEIKKTVIYHQLSSPPSPLFNLSFGDWNDKVSRIDDLVVTNNADKQKVLATVAATVVHFTKQNPNAFIFAAGSTPSRTRLYQMAILSYLALITSLFEVEGFIRNTWELFQTGRNYNAFLLKPKKSLLL